MLFPFAKDDRERDQMMASIAPFWDGNETWLVMGGAGLLVAFPTAYAVVMPAMYLPVIVMLLALVFRGVAFEFREIGKNKALWNVAFAGGSTLAGFAQGIILGGLVQGIAVEGRRLCRRGFRLGDAVRAALRVQRRIRLRVARRDLARHEDHGPGGRSGARPRHMAALRRAGVHGRGQPVDAARFQRIRERWFSLPNFFFLWPVPLFTALAAFVEWRSLRNGGAAVPFLATIGLFLLGFLGLAISSYPYLVPPSLTIWQAAAAPASQTFMLAGTVVLLPLILGYTAYVYWLFRGKIGPGESYH